MYPPAEVPIIVRLRASAELGTRGGAILPNWGVSRCDHGRRHRRRVRQQERGVPERQRLLGLLHRDDPRVPVPAVRHPDPALAALRVDRRPSDPYRGDVPVVPLEQGVACGGRPGRVRRGDVLGADRSGYAVHDEQEILDHPARHRISARIVRERVECRPGRGQHDLAGHHPDRQEPVHAPRSNTGNQQRLEGQSLFFVRYERERCIEYVRCQGRYPAMPTLVAGIADAGIVILSSSFSSSWNDQAM